VSRAIGSGCASISWTYNEPTIWHEYTLDMARSPVHGAWHLLRDQRYITEEALRELSPMLGAFRVDLKAFTDDFYKKICGRVSSRCSTPWPLPANWACTSRR